MSFTSRVHIPDFSLLHSHPDVFVSTDPPMWAPHPDMFTPPRQLQNHVAAFFSWLTPPRLEKAIAAMLLGGGGNPPFFRARLLLLGTAFRSNKNQAFRKKTTQIQSSHGSAATALPPNEFAIVSCSWTHATNSSSFMHMLACSSMFRKNVGREKRKKKKN